MKSRTNSIKDIAAELKVSVTTVSFVLNGKAEEKHISKAMTNKVLAYAKQINYKPNRIAQSLRTGKSQLLVFMVEDISDTSSSKLSRLFEDLAYQNGYKVIFCSIGSAVDKAVELIDFYNFLQVDGFVIASLSAISGITHKIESLIEEGKSIVLLDEYFDNQYCLDWTEREKAANLMETILKLLHS